jgi:hypothetical protein
MTLTIIKGLNPKSRRRIWGSMASVQKMKASYPKGYYFKLRQTQPPLPSFTQINLDLPRTFSL